LRPTRLSKVVISVMGHSQVCVCSNGRLARVNSRQNARQA